MALAMLAGCPMATEPKLDTVAVSGMVTLDGQAVGGATVTFKPKAPDGRAAVGVTDAAGRLTLTTLQAGDGALPGSYAVSITKIAAPEVVPPPGTPGQGGGPSPEQKAKMQGAMKMKAGAEGQKPSTAAPKNELPDKYASPETSGFTAEVKKGEKNEFTFAMTSK
jgi:hypothetical protein